MSSTCIVCGQINEGELMELTDHLVSREVFSLQTCMNCGFRWTHNPPTEEQAGRYYETEEYIEHSNSKNGIINSLYHFGRLFMLRYKLRILKNLSDGKKLLDIGTGTGFFINFLFKNGYNVTGVEINEKARRFAQSEFGLKVYTPDSLFNEGIGSEFDLITFWHVLEHVYNIEEVLEICKNKLNENGKIIIALPNYLSVDARFFGKYWAAYDVPRHLWHFTPNSLELYSNQLGFKLVDSKILPLDSIYISMVSAKYKNSTLSYLTLPLISMLSFIIGVFVKSKSSSIIYILEKR